MNCKICGAKLAHEGELCNNCMNKLMKEQEMKNDVNEFFTFRKKFILRYEIIKHLEQIGVVIFLIILILSVDLSLWKYAVLIAILFSGYGILYLLYDKVSLNSAICILYPTKIVYNYGKFRKKSKIIAFADVEEIRYNQSNLQKVFGIGTISIKKRTMNIMDRFTYIEAVPDIEMVFSKIQEVYNRIR